MAHTLELFRYVSTAAFVWLAAMACVSWRRDRDRAQARLALALGLLGAMLVAGRVNYMTGYRIAVIQDVAVLAFLGSGAAFLFLRDAFVPLPRLVRRSLVPATIGVALAAAAAELPIGTAPHYEPGAFAVVAVVVGVWLVAVCEPIARFWRAARGRPAVQRARLRAMALGYGSIAVAIAVGLASLRLDHREPIVIAVHIASLLVVPILSASVSPPGWLRRVWRSDEEHKIRAAARELVLFAPDEQTLARRALEQAMSLVGADAGYVRGPDGSIMVERGVIDASDVRTLLALRARPEIRTARLPSGRFASATPIRWNSGEGRMILVSGSFTPLFGSDETRTLDEYAGIVAVAFERVALEDELRRQRALTEIVHQAIGDLGEGVLVTDGSRVLYANDALTRIHGYSLEELRAMDSVLDIVVPEDVDRMRCDMASRLRGELAPEHVETAVVAKDGRRIDVELAVKAVRDRGRVFVVTVCRDITERRLAQRRQQETQARLEEAQALAGVGSWSWRIGAPTVDWSAEMYRIHEVGFGTPVSLDAYWSLVHPDDRDELMARFYALVDGGYDGDDVEYRIVLAGGDVRRVHGRGRLSATDDGTPALVGTIQDVTQLRHAEYVLRESERKYAEAYERERAAVRRLEALDEMKNAFLTAVSHELRTPLTSVLGFAQTLSDRGMALTSDERALFVDRLVVNARKLERLLNDILDLDRLRRGILEPRRRAVHLGALVRRVLDEFELARPLHLDVDGVVAHLDAAKVERIVENLLRNAERHTPAGTPVWVRVEARDAGVLLVVEDAGPGVPAELRTTIFEAFSQGSTDDHAPGVGVGLSLVARLAGLHGGRAWVEDRPGGGASFQVLLPAPVEVADAADPDAEEPARRAS